MVKMTNGWLANQELYIHGSARFVQTDATGLPKTILRIAYVKAGLQFAILVSGTWPKLEKWRSKMLSYTKHRYYTDVIVNRKC